MIKARLSPSIWKCSDLRKRTRFPWDSIVGSRLFLQRSPWSRTFPGAKCKPRRTRLSAGHVCTKHSHRCLPGRGPHIGSRSSAQTERCICHEANGCRSGVDRGLRGHLRQLDPTLPSQVGFSVGTTSLLILSAIATDNRDSSAWKQFK